MYTILDILDKLIAIKERTHSVYLRAIENANIVQSVKTIIRVLGKEEQRQITHYKKITLDLCEMEELEVDFDTYDKISKILLIFNNLDGDLRFLNPTDLLTYIMEFEKNYFALIVTIQGILVKTFEDEEKPPYQALRELISIESKHIEALEKFIK